MVDPGFVAGRGGNPLRDTRTKEYGVVGRGDTSYIFMLCSCRLNKCSISYWQSIMNFNTIKQQIEMIIMKNRWLYSLLLVSIIYLVLFYFNFTAYIGDYFEEEKYGFCMHCNESVICGTCKCARTVLHWIVKWWRLSLLHTLCPHYVNYVKFFRQFLRPDNWVPPKSTNDLVSFWHMRTLWLGSMYFVVQDIGTN